MKAINVPSGFGIASLPTFQFKCFPYSLPTSVMQCTISAVRCPSGAATSASSPNQFIDQWGSGGCLPFCFHVSDAADSGIVSSIGNKSSDNGHPCEMPSCRDVAAEQYHENLQGMGGCNWGECGNLGVWQSVRIPARG